MSELLEQAYKKVVTFLNQGHYEYLIIGGIAAATIGEPRFTADVDVDIVLNHEETVKFLDQLESAGFEISKNSCIERIRQTGTFQINDGNFHIDFIICSSELEKSAFNRKQTIKLYNIDAFFPTAEDMILLKAVPARSQDILDIEQIIIRNKEKLDIEYIESWAQRLSDEAQDMRIYNTIKKLLQDNTQE